MKCRPFFVIALFFTFILAGLTACSDDPTAPVERANDFIVILDTTTLKYDTEVGAGWGIEVEATILGPLNAVTSGAFVYETSTPNLVKIYDRGWKPDYEKWSYVDGVEKNVYKGQFNLAMLAPGTAKVTVYNINDKEKIKTYVFNIVTPKG